jgi:protein O-mannosyl-transferase
MFSFLSCWITLVAQHSALVGIDTFPLLPRVANSIISYTAFLAKTVFPFPLAVLYPHPRLFSLWKLSTSLFVILSISILTILKIRRSPWLAVGWFWYIGTLVPVIGLVQVSILGHADRYTYIPLIGLFIMIAWQVPVMFQTWKYRTIALSLSAVGTLSVFGILTSFQVRHWENSIKLFEHALNSTSGNFIAHNNLGFALTQKGNYNEAILHYREAIRIFPGIGKAYSNLGIIAFKQGNFQEAIADYQNAIACNPDAAPSHFLLANSYFELKQINNAIIHYAKALHIRPNYVEAMSNLAVSLAIIGKSDESLALFKEAIRINPDFADARIKKAKLFPEKTESPPDAEY